MGFWDDILANVKRAANPQAAAMHAAALRAASDRTDSGDAIPSPAPPPHDESKPLSWGDLVAMPGRVAGAAVGAAARSVSDSVSDAFDAGRNLLNNAAVEGVRASGQALVDARRKAGEMIGQDAEGLGAVGEAIGEGPEATVRLFRQALAGNPPAVARQPRRIQQPPQIPQVEPARPPDTTGPIPAMPVRDAGEPPKPLGPPAPTDTGHVDQEDVAWEELQRVRQSSPEWVAANAAWQASRGNYDDPSSPVAHAALEELRRVERESPELTSALDIFAKADRARIDRERGVTSVPAAQKETQALSSRSNDGPAPLYGNVVSVMPPPEAPQAQSDEYARAVTYAILKGSPAFDTRGLSGILPETQPSADNQYRMTAEQARAIKPPEKYDAAKSAAMASGDPRIQSLMTNPEAQRKAGVSESQMAAIISGAQGGNAQAIKVLHAILGEPDTDEMTKQEINRMLSSSNRQERLQGMQMAVEMQNRQRSLAAQQAGREDSQAAIMERQKESEAERARAAELVATARKDRADQTDKEQAAKVSAQQGDALGAKLDKLALAGQKGSDGQWKAYFKARAIEDPDMQQSMREAHESMADANAKKATETKELTDWRKARVEERIGLERDAQTLRKTAKDAAGKEQAVKDGIKIASDALNKGHGDLAAGIAARLKKQYPEQADRIDEEIAAAQDNASQWRASFNEARIADANGTATAKQKAILEEGKQTDPIFSAMKEFAQPTGAQPPAAKGAVPPAQAAPPAQVPAQAQPPAQQTDQETERKIAFVENWRKSQNKPLEEDDYYGLLNSPIFLDAAYAEAMKESGGSGGR